MLVGLFRSAWLGLGGPIQCSRGRVQRAPRFSHTALRRAGLNSQLYRVVNRLKPSPGTSVSVNRSLHSRETLACLAILFLVNRRNMAPPTANPGFRLGCQEAPAMVLGLAPRLALRRPAAVSRHRFGISEVFRFLPFVPFIYMRSCSQLKRQSHSSFACLLVRPLTHAIAKSYSPYNSISSKTVLAKKEEKK